jgi:hypothetical protein
MVIKARIDASKPLAPAGREGGADFPAALKKPELPPPPAGARFWILFPFPLRMVKLKVLRSGSRPGSGGMEGAGVRHLDRPVSSPADLRLDRHRALLEEIVAS